MTGSSGFDNVGGGVGGGGGGGGGVGGDGEDGGGCGSKSIKIQSIENRIYMFPPVTLVLKVKFATTSQKWQSAHTTTPCKTHHMFPTKGF